ncbi:MAG: insulinase family protein, partial [Gemmatimonadota bacterium]|nr:insulinase family protein [Gemmatimonadota bacterium]
VAGDVTPEEALVLAERRFGGWAGASSPAGDADASPYPPPVGIVVVDRPGSVQSEIRAGHVGISLTDPDYFRVQVMNQILGGAFASRLNLNLRERHGYTYGVSSSFTPRRKPGPFLVSTAVQSEVTAPAVREILREVAGMREAPPTAAELDDARSYLAGVFPLRMETVTGIASRLVQLAVHELPDDYFHHYRDRILDVSGEEVLRVARARLRPEELAVVVVGDAAQLRGPLEALEVGEVRVMDAAEVDG